MWILEVHAWFDGQYNITFQVWRPVPEVELNGCHSFVAHDRYNNIPLGQDGLVDWTLPSVISVQPGDVIGHERYAYIDLKLASYLLYRKR